MWRPRNESREDLATEEAARVEIGRALSCELVKLSPVLYGVDWAAFRGGRLIAFAEYKRRYNPMARYPTLHLSLAKVASALQLAASAGVACTLFVQWDDGIFWCPAADHLPGAILAGNSRGQNGDREPIVEYPIDRFRPIRQ